MNIRLIAILLLGILAAGCSTDERSESSPASWPETVFVVHMEKVTRMDSDESILMEALSVFNDIQVFEYRKDGPLLLAGVLKMHQIKKVQSLTSPNLYQMTVLRIDDPALIISVSTDGTVDMPRPVEAPEMGGVYASDGALPLRVLFLEDGRALAVLSDEDPYDVYDWIEAPGRAHVSIAKSDGAAIRFEMPLTDGTITEFVGVVTPFGILTARPEGLSKQLRYYEVPEFMKY